MLIPCAMALVLSELLASPFKRGLREIWGGRRGWEKGLQLLVYGVWVGGDFGSHHCSFTGAGLWMFNEGV